MVPPHSHGQVCVGLVSGRKLLLVRQRGAAAWSPVSGPVRAGETLVGAAVRAVATTTSWQLPEDELDLFYATEDDHAPHLVAFLTAPSPASPLRFDRAVEHGWFDASAAAHLPADGHASAFLQQWAARHR